MMRAPVYDRWGVQVHHGDCLDVLQEFPDGHFSAVITDPPYSYRFMGKSWDAHESPLAFQQWCERWARECLRVLRPGGHLLAFGGARTAHRLTCGIEDAKSEIRDGIDWLYAGGMPKGNNISKAIDRQAGAEREVIGEKLSPDGVPSAHSAMETTPATDAARRWEGWNTQLRPAHELITVARKPFRGSVAANVLAHGTGGINVDACRVGTDVITQHGRSAGQSDSLSGPNIAEAPGRSWTGRWPPNVILSHVPSVDPATGEVVGDACAQGCVDGCPVRELDQQSGERPSGRPQNRFTKGDKFGGSTYGSGMDQCLGWAKSPGYVDSGGASRFFPCFRFEAKAPTAERPRVWTAPTTKLRLREDLTEQERDHVLSELRRVGVDVS